MKPIVLARERDPLDENLRDCHKCHDNAKDDEWQNGTEPRSK